MANKLSSGPIFIHRSLVLDGLRALYLAQLNFDQVLEESSFASGYREGFSDALLSIAHTAGVSDELEETSYKLHTHRTGKLKVISN